MDASAARAIVGAAMTTAIDRPILDAAVAVIAEHGWDGLTLERVAERAALSRPTLWRRGIRRDQLIAAILKRLAESYREAMLGAVLTEGSGRDRLERAMNALFDVADQHLQLLSASDTEFHEAGPARGVRHTPYISPLERLLRDGIADGSIAWSDGRKIEDFAVVLFNIVWTYVHLRAKHGWSARRTRNALLPPLLASLD
jgi:AcrR family transcriptional regulator